jgi:hypothetical protein
VGLAVAALGDQLFKAMDIEAANDKMAAQLGLMPEQAAAVGRVSGELFAGAYGDSMEDVNDAIVGVSQNMQGLFDGSEEGLKAVTATAMDFAAVFGEDVTASTRAAGIMIRNGLAKDAQEAFDILTVGMQSGANAGEDLLDTFDEYSPLFAKLGLSGTQALGMISQSMQAGARDSDFAADAIKEFSIRAIDGSDLTVKSFQALGLNADKMRATFAKGGPESAAAMDLVMDKLRGMKDPAKQAEVAVGLFGTKAEDLAGTLAAMDPSEAVASMGQVEGAANQMSTTLADNAKTKLESFKRTIETNVSNFIGEQVLPRVVELAEKAAPAFDTFRQAAETAFNWVAGKPEALGAIAAVVGTGLVIAFGALAVSAWGAAAGVIAATWPILAIGAAIGGLVGLLMYAYNNWEMFRNVVDTVVRFIQDNAAPAFEMIKQAVITFYEMALAPLIRYIQENGEAFANIGKVLLVVAGIILGVVVVAIATVVVQWLVMVAVAAIVIVGVVAIIAVLYNLAQVLWDVLNNVRDWMGGVIDAVENIVQVFWDMANNVGTAIANVIRALWMVIQVGWDLAQNIGSAIADAVRWVWSLAMKANDMANEIGAAIGRAVAWFFDLPNRIQSAVGDLGSVLLSAGRDVVAGLIRGVTDKIGELRSKLGELTGLIPSWKGPPETDRKLLRPTGGLIMGGLMEGIAARVPDLRRQLQGISSALPSDIGVSGAVSGGSASLAPAGAGVTHVHNWYVQGSILTERGVVQMVQRELTNLGFAGAMGST